MTFPIVVALVAAFSVQQAVVQQPTSLLCDHECGSEQTLVAELASFRVYVSCSTSGERRVLKFNVVGSSTQLVRDFSIGFCGEPVVVVESPRGWKREGETPAGDVRWTATYDAAEEKRNGQSGFSVTLNPGWRLSGAVRVGWLEDGSGGGGGLVSGVTHGCD